MKTIFLSIAFIFIYFLSFSQMADTIKFSEQEMKKQILFLQWDISSLRNSVTNISAGGASLKKASGNYFTGLALTVVGSSLIVLGASSSRNEGEVFGSLIVVVGFAFQISAWGNINKAGKIIRNSNR